MKNDCIVEKGEIWFCSDFSRLVSLIEIQPFIKSNSLEMLDVYLSLYGELINFASPQLLLNDFDSPIYRTYAIRLGFATPDGS